MFNTYQKRLAKLAEHLINTYDTFLDEPEHLKSPADLKRFLHRYDILGEPTDADLAAVRDLRSQLRAAWNADALATNLALLNPILSTVPATLHLHASEADAQRSTVQYKLDSSLSLVDQLRFEAALGVSAALEMYGLERLRSCASEPCRDVFIDTSRNRSRRFCSERCANRYNVQAFRSRQRE
jgi:predicted RNA-binding Zn ribbon-like protein